MGAESRYIVNVPSFGSGMMRLAVDDEALIDEIYESAFVPELWRTVLRRLGGFANTRAAWIFVMDNERGRFVGSTRLVDQAVMPPLKSGELASSERLRRLIAARHPGFLREADLYAEEEMEKDVFYQKYIFPLGLGSGAGTLIATPTKERLVITVERQRMDGPFEPEIIRRLDRLRPHLARSLMTASRLHLERVEATATALAALGLPALMLNGDGRVLAANALMESLPGGIHWKAHDRIGLSDRAAEQFLRGALAQLGASHHGGVRTFAIRHDETERVLIANFVPIRRSARDLFGRCDAALILTPMGRIAPAPFEVLQTLFDLTPAESRIAGSLAEGEALEAIAAKLGVTRNTASTHLKRVFAKTGCKRQAELVGLLSGLRAVRTSQAHKD